MTALDEIIRRVKNLDSEQQEDILNMLRDWQAGKQREYPRRETSAEIDVVVGNRVIQTTTRDMSASGIFINTSGRFETDKTVRIVFSVPGYDKPFKLEGMIVRVEENGLAIKFENITPYFKQILDDAIWENQKSGGKTG